MKFDLFVGIFFLLFQLLLTSFNRQHFFVGDLCCQLLNLGLLNLKCSLILNLVLGIFLLLIKLLLASFLRQHFVGDSLMLNLVGGVFLLLHQLVLASFNRHVVGDIR